MSLYDNIDTSEASKAPVELLVEVAKYRSYILFKRTHIIFFT